MKRKFWAIGLTMVTALSLAGCGGGGGEADTSVSGSSGGDSDITVGRVVFDLSHPYQQADSAFSEATAKELGINYVAIDGESDAETQANGMTDFVSQGVDGIIVQPLDSAAIQPSVDEALAAGIPVVSFYQAPEDHNVPVVMIDEKTSSFELGALAAEKWTEWYPDQPIKIAIIDQPDVAFVVENRSDAFIEGVQSVAPDAEVVARLDGKGVRDTSMTAGDDLLQSHPEANIILGVNSDSALGALAAYEAAGRGKAEDGVPVSELFVSIDGTEPELIKIFDPASSLKMTMALSAKSNGTALIETMKQVIDGEIPMDEETVVTTQNKILDYYNMTVEDEQAFLEEEMNSTIDLKEEIGLE